MASYLFSAEFGVSVTLYHIKKNYAYVCKQGVGFSYHGDEVIYLWLWQRDAKNKKWLSIGFGSCFGCLEEIDDMWDAYSEAMQR